MFVGAGDEGVVNMALSDAQAQAQLIVGGRGGGGSGDGVNEVDQQGPPHHHHHHHHHTHGAGNDTFMGDASPGRQRYGLMVGREGACRLNAMGCMQAHCNGVRVACGASEHAVRGTCEHEVHGNGEHAVRGTCEHGSLNPGYHTRAHSDFCYLQFWNFQTQTAGHSIFFEKKCREVGTIAVGFLVCVGGPPANLNL